MSTHADQPELRDEALARLVAEAAKPGTMRDQDCPDAERVAAYADQTLAADERSGLEIHFAACARCQKLLAALGAGLEETVGESAIASPSPDAVAEVQRPSQPVRSPRHWFWWLSPAFGAAAAGLLWMALRPAQPAPVQTAANYSVAPRQETQALNGPVEPSPAAEAPEAAIRRRDVQSPRQDAQSLDELAKTQPAAKEAQAKAQEPTVAQVAAPPADSAPVAPSPAPAPRPEGARDAQPSVAIAQAMSAPAPASAPLTQNQAAAVGRSADSPPVQARALAPAGTIEPLQVSTERLDVAAQSLAQLTVYTFAPPGGGAMWRLGLAGQIQRSTDQGKTWQAQSSGVTVELIAGSAASPDAAWVVGRDGVILRTADGERWEKIAGPAGVTSQWAAVAAHDAMSATVVADDLRRFSTQDGGKTWTLQQ